MAFIGIKAKGPCVFSLGHCNQCCFHLVHFLSLLIISVTVLPIFISYLFIFIFVSWGSHCGSTELIRNSSILPLASIADFFHNHTDIHMNFLDLITAKNLTGLLRKSQIDMHLCAGVKGVEQVSVMSPLALFFHKFITCCGSLCVRLASRNRVWHRHFCLER